MAWLGLGLLALLLCSVAVVSQEYFQERNQVQSDDLPAELGFRRSGDVGQLLKAYGVNRNFAYLPSKDYASVRKPRYFSGNCYLRVCGSRVTWIPYTGGWPGPFGGTTYYVPSLVRDCSVYDGYSRGLCVVGVPAD